MNFNISKHTLTLANDSVCPIPKSFRNLAILNDQNLLANSLFHLQSLQELEKNVLVITIYIITTN